MMQEVAPWPVAYIDPAAAIARQTEVVLSQLNERKHAATPIGANQLLYTGADTIGENILSFFTNHGSGRCYPR